MNGPVKMYAARQIVQHDFAVALPTSMYKIKNIHRTAKTRNGIDDGAADHVSSSPPRKVDISDQNNQNVPGMAELQQRQEQILKQLGELKKQMLSIKSDLAKSNNTTTKTTCVSPKNLPSEVVLNVNPTNPPYSLELVQKLLQDSFNLAVTSHLHSTAPQLPKNASDLNERLSKFTPRNKGVPKINLRLIWKNIDAKVELIVSHTPIIGEVNFLRYLSRLTANSLSYNQDVEIDSLLDVCYLIAMSKNKTGRVKLLQNFTVLLGKNASYLTKNKFGIVDVAAYSAIKQVTNSDEVNITLNKWLQKCETAVN